ncbi:MAG: MOSC domain-containing protein [Pseudomonadota bacterium]
MGAVSAIYRFPVKGLGEEALTDVALEAGKHMPLDRGWAITHGRSIWDPDAPAHIARRHFVQTADAPALAATVLRRSGDALTVEGAAARFTGDIATEAGRAGLAAWALTFAGDAQPGPYAMVRLPGSALTDVEEAHLSIMSDVTLRAVSDAAGMALDRRRFRGNIWLEGLAPWQEFEWVGREIMIGALRFRITDPIGRCNAPAASPATGRRDCPVTEVLYKQWRHTDFGVYAQVVEAGTLRSGDPVLAP